MKKFVSAAAALALCLLGLWYAVYYRGFYFGSGNGAGAQAAFKTEGTQLLARDGTGQWQPFTVKGVELSPGLPGSDPTDYAVDEETWLRWLGQISAMGANTVRVDTIYNDAFYNAFYRFNTGGGGTLYLLQGLQVSDYANNSSADAYGVDFYGALKEDVYAAVDVVHGRRNISLNRLKGSGAYRRDVSPWVLGYIIGSEWDAGTIAYTNHNTAHAASYAGEYFETAPGATAFEAMLAQLMDRMVAYETEKYGVQRLVAFMNDPQNDPFAYDTFYAKQLGKYNRLDAEHILPTERLLSGCFAAYRLYEFCPGFSEYFSSSQKSAVGNILTQLDCSLFYDGYTQLLSRYHSMPVVIASYGFSTARGTDGADGPLTERQQGARLVEVYEDIVASGCSGAVIGTWQDVWSRRTWNTSYAVDVEEASRWHDVQTAGQGGGLLAFEPGADGPVCVVDGSGEEWTQEDAVLEQEGISLSARQDAEALYLLIRREEISEAGAIYVPIDVTPLSGAAHSAQPALQFTRGADFLLCLSGTENSRLLVQARYEPLRENYLQETEGQDPFVSPPEKDSPLFVPVNMIVERGGVLTAEQAAVLTGAQRMPVYETGLLHHGTADPGDANYDSLADFCYGDDLVEVRLPWQLLNFYNPADRQVHADYYEHYGVEPLQIDEIYLGVCTEGVAQAAYMEPFALTGWKEVPYRERLKLSYRIIQESWGGRDAL